MVNNSIYERIEEKGKEDALEIRRLGESKAKQIEVSTLKEANQNITKILLKTKDKHEVLLKTKKSELLQKTRQRILLHKKRIIDNLLLEEVKVLNSLPDSEYERLVQNLILSDNLKGNEILKVNDKDYPRFLKLFSSGKLVDGLTILDKLNLKLGDLKYQLRLSNQAVKITGGFLVIGDAFDIDHSFEEILKIIKERYETDIAKILFPIDKEK